MHVGGGLPHGEGVRQPGNGPPVSPSCTRTASFLPSPSTSSGAGSTFGPLPSGPRGPSKCSSHPRDVEPERGYVVTLHGVGKWQPRKRQVHGAPDRCWQEAQGPGRCRKGLDGPGPGSGEATRHSSAHPKAPPGPSPRLRPSPPDPLAPHRLGSPRAPGLRRALWKAGGRKCLQLSPCSAGSPRPAHVGSHGQRVPWGRGALCTRGTPRAS